ncbi:MAG: hypothetical protein DYG89_05425 [Caldilinea sp. CFX5]|nr:hypothetical protein [Caldilinea sp. CFX5]
MGDKMHAPTDPYYFAWGKNRFYECYSAKPDLSLKCMFNGPGSYTTGDGGRFVVDDNAYLILNRQQPYSLIKQGETPVESFCVFYAAAWAQDILSSLTAPDLSLLDNPTPDDSPPLSFFERLYPHNNFVTPSMQALRAYVVNVSASGVWVEERLHSLLAGMIQTQWNVFKEAEQLPVARQSTRLELYRRLYRARDYIHAALAEPLSLADIAGAAHLSPHHFLRIFKQAAEYLLAQGAPLTICAAAMLGQYAAVVRFLDEDSAQVNAQGAHGIPLFFHAALSGDTAITELLLVRGGGMGVATSLHAAVKFGHVAMTQWLLAHGAEINGKDFQGQTPLEVAVAQGYTEIAAILRAHPVNVL